MGGWIIETTHIAQTDVLKDSLTEGPSFSGRERFAKLEFTYPYWRSQGI